MGERVRWVHQETQVCQEVEENQECRAHQQEEQSTLAGAGIPAPLARELSSSMLAELEGHLRSQEHRGRAANRQCLPNDPDHLPHQSEV